MKGEKSILLYIAVFMCVMRFVWLERSPPGFFVDEAAGAVNVMTYQQQGVTPVGEKWPFFTPALGEGFTSPTYFYFAFVWTKIFGTSVSAFRSIAALFNILTIAGLFFLVYKLVDLDAALWVVLFASISPWSFQFSRIAWDPPLAPCFLIWGCALLLQGKGYRSAVLAGLSFSLAMISYPPTRLHVLLFLPAFLLIRKDFENLNVRRLSLVVLAMGVLTAPTFVMTLGGSQHARLAHLSLFSNHIGNPVAGQPFLTRLGQLVKNFGVHFSSDFLFLHGDRNLRHSTQFFGLMSWPESLAFLFFGVLWFLRRAPAASKTLLFLGAWGLMTSFIPAAVTWEMVPHALRSIGGWPFLVLFTGLCQAALVRWRRFFSLLGLTVTAAYVVVFLWAYFVLYPLTSRDYFDTQIVRFARLGKERGDWKGFELMAKRYQPEEVNYLLYEYRGQALPPVAAAR